MIDSRIPRDLLEELERAFPERGLRPGEDPSAAYYAAGARDVIVYMRRCYDKQQDEAVRDLYDSQITGLPERS